ncbi:hypothetical protein NPIL_530451 [Nephila pilipes]|uniref:Uncharacterized protein n=1 Tax=Nephila pilipes TaxID=299642 RepID=A0A8X6U0D2_NEPPI|nr:hypothetical protein NPIL_34871 [Nephila pilipes]GFU36257.1 hypothetical protein NPIL_530451 [Nephila pilipes]
MKYSVDFKSGKASRVTLIAIGVEQLTEVAMIIFRKNKHVTSQKHLKCVLDPFGYLILVLSSPTHRGFPPNRQLLCAIRVEDTEMSIKTGNKTTCLSWLQRKLLW